MEHEASKGIESTTGVGHEVLGQHLGGWRSSRFASFANLRGLVFLAILSVYLALAVLYAAITPAWQAPDEPAHYNYVAYVAEQAALPVLHFGDYPHGYLEQIKTAKFPPDMPVTPIRYESHQPPLYYVLLAPLYRATAGELTALRLASVVLGAGIVIMAYAIGRRIFPARSILALSAAAFVAFLPQHLATVSQVGNDVLAELLYAGVLYVLVGWVTVGERTRLSSDRSQIPAILVVGILLGLIAVTKTTAYIAAGLVAGVVIWKWIATAASARRIAADAALLILPAALIAVPWFARNAFVYGWPDLFGLIRHDQIVAGQPRAAQFIKENGLTVYARRAVEFTFKSFWGVFGWLSAFMDSRVYLVLALFTGTALMGALSAVRRVRRPSARRVAVLFVAAILLTLITYLYYNTSFVQHQGRYLFTALIPISLAVAWGWDASLQPRTARAIAAGMIVVAVLVAAYGLLTPAGPSKWPIVLVTGFAIALAGISALPPAWRRAAYVTPFVLLPLVSLYALYSVIGPQLGR